MTTINKDYVDADIIDVLKLTNNTYLQGKNFAGNGFIDILKVDVNNRIVFASVPQVAADPSDNNDLTRKSWVTTQLGNYQLTSAKGQANGYVGLNASSLIDSAFLPSYVDDVIEAANFAALPTVGAAASVVYDTVTFTAVTRGTAGNSISLTFNGTTDDLDTIVNAWNSANPTNTVGFTGQLGTYIPAAGSPVFTGGVNTLAETGKIYVTIDTAKTYRFSGTVYVEISAAPVISVNGQTGAVSLTADDVPEAGSPTNKYFTETRVRASVLTGLSSTAGAVAATDSILAAIGKLDGNYLSRYNRITLLKPQTGLSVEYTTINAALAAIPAATDAATARQTYVLIVPAGTYDEDISFEDNNRRVIIVCLGTVNLGTLTGSSWGAGGTARNFAVTNDGTASINSIRSGLAIVGIDQIGDGFSSHQSYLNSKFRISGNLSLASSIGISSEFMFGGVEVFGNLDASGYSGNCNVYMKNSRVRGTAGGTPMRLQRAENCQFDGLVTVAVFGIMDKSNFAAGFTTAAAAGDFTHQGFFNCYFAGAFTGPAGSAKFDPQTNYWFVLSSATLAGGATKVILANNEISGADAEELEFTMSAQNVIDQYVDLGFAALAGSVNVYPDGGPRQKLTTDYTLNYTGGTGGVTRLSFVNGGTLNLKMIEGKKMTVTYFKA